MVLVNADLYRPISALWITSYPEAQFVHREYPDAWLCCLFRREPECPTLASELIIEAVACTRWKYGEPLASGMITMIDARKTRHKRDPGRCYRRAGFLPVGFTKTDGLYILQLLPEDMPEAVAPKGISWESEERAS